MGKLDFRDKWVIVTGASSGLGRELSIRLASEEGANVVVSARRLERLLELQGKISSEFGREVVAIKTDLSDPKSINNLYSAATENRRIFAIINNAGITDFAPAEFSKIELYEKILDVNFRALMTLSLKFMNYFRNKGGGAILNITSMGGLFPLVYQNVYSASKHAAQVFTEILRAENEDKNITISSFAPGGIATEMLEYTGLGKKRGADSLFNQSPEKVAKAALRSLKKGKLLGIPGPLYSSGLQLKRILPRKLLLKLLKNSYK